MRDAEGCTSHRELGISVLTPHAQDPMIEMWDPKMKSGVSEDEEWSE